MGTGALLGAIRQHLLLEAGRPRALPPGAALVAGRGSRPGHGRGGESPLLPEGGRGRWGAPRHRRGCQVAPERLVASAFVEAASGAEDPQFGSGWLIQPHSRPRRGLAGTGPRFENVVVDRPELSASRAGARRLRSLGPGHMRLALAPSRASECILALCRGPRKCNRGAPRLLPRDLQLGRLERCLRCTGCECAARVGRG
mmetsp:Transcript_152647/g.489556  ORF Transcript_152647/g.489556 Transcript_152647/m.489556 type:complete len:200 (-) Transcript_152647:451-1050(-)